jgi:DNA-binding transcriptional LysR family regulator
MEFRQLEAFRAIADELHFGRAAKKLYLAQPSISQLLQKLESELGVLLVHRNSRRVQLTAAGQVFLTETSKIFAAVERATLLTRQAAAGRRGAVRIATNYPASRLLLLPLLERLRQVDSQLTTMLREMSSPDQFTALLRDELDLGLVYGPVAVPGIESRRLLAVPIVATVRAGHPLADRETLNLAQIADFPYLPGHAGGSSLIDEAIISTALAHGIRLPNAAVIADVSSYQLALETTDTIGFSSLPRGEQSRAGGMHLLTIEPEQPMLELHVAWNPLGDERLVNAVVAELSGLASELRSGS